MSNHAHRRRQSELIPTGRRLGFWQRTRLFFVWFFAPRPAPRAWQRKPYLRNRDRRPGKFR